MKIYLVGREKLLLAFSKIKKRDEDVEWMPVSELKKKIETIPTGSLVYVDIFSLSDVETNKIIKLLEKRSHILWGIVDEKNAIKDPAELFHRGAVDYIGKEVIKLPLTSSRIRRISAFKNIAVQKEFDKGVMQFQYIPSGSDWSNVKEGEEYTFCMMFFELDHQLQLKKNSSEQQIKERSQIVHDFLEKMIKPINGKIWMWSQFCGIVLIPFDGKSCDVILTAVRMWLNRTIISIEECKLGLKISFRIVLHIGNTVYRERGNTGTIVSDSINSLFHLGQKFAKAGELLLTEEVTRFIPAGIKDLFVDAGMYERRNIYKFVI
ncbi:MAG: hypothetical protein N2316_12825 [Spirochaetes bacterium]|nr:hypothetical protein [Spirochaetota bacterium]